MKKVLESKDLINVGVFTAIYFVVFFGCMMLGYMPIFIVALPIVCSIVSGIPFMLYLSKVKKFGMISLTGTIVGLIHFLMGSGIFCLILGVIFGILADLILKSGDYKSSKKTIIGYGTFSLWLIGFLMPIFIMRETYFNSLRVNYGDDYVNTLINFIPEWSLPLLIVLTFISGIIGAWVGKKVLKKHFERVGIV